MNHNKKYNSYLQIEKWIRSNDPENARIPEEVEIEAKKLIANNWNNSIFSAKNVWENGTKTLPIQCDIFAERVRDFPSCLLFKRTIHTDCTVWDKQLR